MRARGEASEAGAFTKFRLLMWKNFLQQWRHPIQTVVEVLLPVASMALMLVMRSQIEPTQRDTFVYPAFPAHSLNYSTRILSGMNYSELSIAYSPTSPELENVVSKAITNLLLKNIDDLLPLIEESNPGLIPLGFQMPSNVNRNSTDVLNLIQTLVKIIPYESSEALAGLYKLEQTTREVIAAVQFDDSLRGATELPDVISYSLRFPQRPRLNSFYTEGGQSWRTDQVLPSFATAGPRESLFYYGGNNPGYVSEMFIALQNAISMELISSQTGEDLDDFDINLKRYPYPAYLEDFAVDILQILLPLFFSFSFIYTVVNITQAITVEKQMQLKESMKIMGLPTWLHWTAWFWKQFIFLFFAAVLILIILKVSWFSNSDGYSDYALFTNTPWTVLLFFIVLYLTCAIFFCFMVSSMFSDGGRAALFAGVFWFVTSVPVSFLSSENNVSTGSQLFAYLFINSAMTTGFELILAEENSGGMQWGEFLSNPATESTKFTFGLIVVMLVVDCVLYMLAALYLEQVLPGPYGAPKKWYFPFQASFWCPKRGQVADVTYMPNYEGRDVLIEPDPAGHTIGVQMKELTKIFGSHVAVNRLSLNIYDDQITVLLGHNGAGKSTTISMLTGNVEVTSGSVSVAGYDMSRQAQYARAHLGLCAQHNVLFDELTVAEHLEFFGRLKGYSGKELKDDIDSLIEKLELKEKSNYQSQGLSGGQKRRLCVGIALCGGAKVVLLDEPTSGMDPASRRALWDLLQKEKRGRSMILTTHFMDEADFLGDRVAIMAQGRLQCVGSPHFLKRHHGVGYSLVVGKTASFDLDACTELVSRYIPGTTITDDRGTEVTYSLLNEHAHLFEAMLNDLERNMDRIKFKNYGLTATTLEDVFLSMGADVAPVDSVSDGTFSSEAEALEQLTSLGGTTDVTGWRLLCQHVLAVWMKLGLVWSRSWGMLLLQLVVPLAIINTTLLASQLSSSVETVVPRNLSLTDGYARTETLLSFDGTSETSLGALAKSAYENIYENSGIDTMALTVIDGIGIDDYYLDRAQDSVELGKMRTKMLIGATFEEQSATAHFSNFGYHDVATSLAAVHSALLRARRPAAQIHVYNHPLEATYANQDDLQMLLALSSMRLANGIGTSVAIVSAVFVMFYVRERACGAKLLQKAAGLQPATLWLSSAVFDGLCFLLIGLTILASCAIFDVSGLGSGAGAGRLLLLIVVYGAAMLPLNYLFSLLFKGPAVGFVVVFFMNVMFGALGPQVADALAAPQLDTQHIADILDGILQVFPLYSFVASVSSLNYAALSVESCRELCSFYEGVLADTTCDLHTMCQLLPDSCCIRDDAPFTWEEPGILRYLVMMLISCAVLWTVLLLVEYRLLRKLFTMKRAPPPLEQQALDQDVVDERRHVECIGKAHLAQHGLVARNLSKYYGKHLAVNQLNFTVNDSECFGLLGVNGAGKTTTFKMLMGDESISHGSAHIAGYSVETQLTKVHQHIGYCPQFDALFEELTGAETLLYFSLLRGLDTQTARVHSTALATALGFMPHLNKKVGQYSGGTKRKLNTAISFLGNTRLVFVDEPTTGVDPAAKRHVWRAVRGVQRSGRGVVLTSHSMEECEALCSRLTIMVNGRFQCLGTPQHLKNKFSQGYTLTIKMRTEPHDRNSTLGAATYALKDYINRNFREPKIMEEYEGLVTYYLADTRAAWSRMFGVMERAKRELRVEHYSISQTTLEQIFLQFTKYQQTEP